MTTILSMKTYDIHIGYNLIDSLFDLITCLNKIYYKYVLITDENLFKIYGNQMLNKFHERQIDLVYYTIPSGEKSKNRQEKANIENLMFENDCNVDSLIIGFGGGVVGDLSGFIASTYMRGIDYILIPTSFLSMVDSSIGGKTAINVEPYGKNLLGAFYHPKCVIIDLNLLETLSSRDFSNGMAEVIKIALISDKDFFEFIEDNTNKIIEKDKEITMKIVYESIKLKLHVVTRDEKETSGLRSILNFGHSVGHAIEILSNEKLLHGECVSIGMLFECQLSINKGFLSYPDQVFFRLNRILKSFDLPTQIPFHIDSKQIIEKMSIDKKNRNGKKQIVILTNIGSVKDSPPYTTTIEDEDLIHLLNSSVSLSFDKTKIRTTNISIPSNYVLSNFLVFSCSLGSGQCQLTNLLCSMETYAILDYLQQLNIKYYWNDEQELVIQGKCGKFHTKQNVKFHLRNMKRSSLFFLALLTLLPERTWAIVDKDEQLNEDSIKNFIDIFIKNEKQIKHFKHNEYFPLEIEIYRQFQGGEIILNENVSTESLESLFLVSLFALQHTTLKIDSDQCTFDKSSVDMIIELMKRIFHISIEKIHPLSYKIPNVCSFQNPFEIQIEGDLLLTSYFLGIAAIHPDLTITITNFGSNSFQNGNKFIQILKSMGCDITQTESTTTLIAPKELVALDESIDFNDIRQCLIALICISVFSLGQIEIRNIPNENSKEFKQISILIEQLSKCNVPIYCRDHILTVRGNNNNDIDTAIFINCFNDYQIAMAFSIVGTRAPHLIIDDKHSVDEIFPQFWFYLEKTFPLKVLSANQRDVCLKPSFNYKSNFKRIYLIGMPCSGKTTIGKFVAKRLNFSFIDTDQEIMKQIQEDSIENYIEIHGYEQFRSLELKVFQEIQKKVESSSENFVISFGGGAVETKEIRMILSEENYVIYLNRHLNDIKIDYSKRSQSSKSSISLNEKFKERQVFYRKCSTYEYFLLKNDVNIETNQMAFLTFLQKILRDKDLSKFPISDQSFFICLTYRNLLNVPNDDLLNVISGADAVELRIDLLDSYQIDFIAKQISHLRRITSLPIIYTLRTNSDFGTFQGNDNEMFDVLNYGLRFGCDFIDFQLNSNENIGNSWFSSIEKKCSYVIGSFHMNLSEFDVNSIETLSNRFRHVHVFKFVFKIDDERLSIDGILFKFYQLKQMLNEILKKRFIFLFMGDKGKLTRIINEFLTPVTHELLPCPAAQGQLTIKQIQEIRLKFGFTQLKQFYLFGNNIQHSPSPIFHQFGFDYFHLPYKYDLYQTNDFSMIENLLKQPNFAGASVTIPFKEKLADYMIRNQNNKISDAVKKIRVINSIQKLSNDTFLVDNTDWMAIQKLIYQTCSDNHGSVLIIGSGATARSSVFALKTFDFIDRIYIYNPRRYENAMKLTEDFNDSSVLLPISESQLKDVENLFLVISTIPSTINFMLDEIIFEKSLSKQQRSILFDVNYNPYETTLIKQALKYNWKIIFGIEMFVEQALQQFHMWTDKPIQSFESTFKQNFVDYLRSTYYNNQDLSHIVSFKMFH